VLKPTSVLNTSHPSARVLVIEVLGGQWINLKLLQLMKKNQSL
jgi:hypothetical protein